MFVLDAEYGNECTLVMLLEKTGNKLFKKDL